MNIPKALLAKRDAIVRGEEMVVSFVVKLEELATSEAVASSKTLRLNSRH